MTADTIPVRLPLPGESLMLRPLERRVGWYQVHRTALGPMPHVADHCKGCSWPRTAQPLCWTGYLLCRTLPAPGARLVVVIPASVYERCASLQDQEADLRDALVEYWRERSRGGARLALKVEYAHGDLVEELPRGLSHSPHLLGHWRLPEDQPEYRQQVYWQLLPRVAPDPDTDTYVPAAGEIATEAP